jgi:hypothetical protein
MQFEQDLGFVVESAVDDSELGKSGAAYAALVRFDDALEDLRRGDDLGFYVDPRSVVYITPTLKGIIQDHLDEKTTVEETIGIVEQTREQLEQYLKAHGYDPEPAKRAEDEHFGRIKDRLRGLKAQLEAARDAESE